MYCCSQVNVIVWSHDIHLILIQHLCLLAVAHPRWLRTAWRCLSNRQTWTHKLKCKQTCLTETCPRRMLSRNHVILSILNLGNRLKAHSYTQGYFLAKQLAKSSELNFFNTKKIKEFSKLHPKIMKKTRKSILLPVFACIYTKTFCTAQILATKTAYTGWSTQTDEHAGQCWSYAALTWKCRNLRA